MKSAYRINNFLCHSLPNGDLVVQTVKGIMKIHDRKLIDTILLWDKYSKKEVTELSLEQQFKEDKKELLEFLVINGLLEEIKEKIIQIDSIAVISNDLFVNQLLIKTLEDDFKDKLLFKSIHLDNIQPAEENELSLVFLNPYNKNLGKSIRDRHFQTDNSYLLMGYIYNNQFYMDSLYNPNWRNPCHCCHIGHIESSMRIGSADNLTYQQIIDMLYSIDQNTEIGMPLTNAQRIIIVASFIQRIQLFINDFTYSKIHHEDINRAMTMKLDNFKRYEDTPIHWELCDCYE